MEGIAVGERELYLFKQAGRKLAIHPPSGRRVKLSDAAWDAAHQLQLTGRRNEKQPGWGELVERNHCGQFDAVTPPPEAMPTGILSCLLNLTHRCNLACRYCIMGHPTLKQGYQDVKEVMSAKTAFRAIDLLSEQGSPPVNLVFFGGEPLLAFERMRETVLYAEQHYAGRFTYSVITNGTLLTEEQLPFLRQHRFGILFSLDGDQAMHDTFRVYPNGRGSFRDVFRAVSLVQQQAPELDYKVNVTYFKSTTMMLEQAFRFFCENGIAHSRYERGVTAVDADYAVTMEMIPMATEQLGRLARLYCDRLLAGGRHEMDTFLIPLRRLAKGVTRRRGCNMGIDYWTVAADGQIYPCHKLVGRAEFSLGSVWRTEADRRWREYWERSVERRPKCSRCWARYVCGGYCVADNYHANGDFFEPSPENCRLMQATIRWALWLLTELEEKAPSVLKDLVGDDYLLTDERWRPSAKAIVEPPVIRNRETGEVCELNKLAWRIWYGCEQGQTLGEIGEALALETACWPEVVTDDVLLQVQRLRQSGLLVK